MPTLETGSLGTLDYCDNDVIDFPLGLPGFEHEQAFVPVDREGSRPIVFLQSVTTPKLFFLTVPVEFVDNEYELRLLDEYREVLGMSYDAAPGPALDVFCLAIVCVPEQGAPTANLLGPLVIHRQNRTGVQAIRDDARYSAQHPLFLAV